MNGVVQKWHPDKQKDPDNSTIRFQEINEAYQGQCYFLIFEKFSRISVVCFSELNYGAV